MGVGATRAELRPYVFMRIVSCVSLPDGVSIFYNKTGKIYLPLTSDQ
jgi:hypothetical protein